LRLRAALSAARDEGARAQLELANAKETLVEMKQVPELQLTLRTAGQEGLRPDASPCEYYARRYERGTDMSDYTTATGHDTTRVQIAEGNQVRYWCDSLGCTEAQLRESVEAVGESPANVRDFLKTLTQRGLF
jgi:hypothetical protein